MQLEERVKALEREVQVLKNEIKNVLLDIREQVLIHRYPALRAEGDSLNSSQEQAATRPQAPLGTEGTPLSSPQRQAETGHQSPPEAEEPSLTPVQEQAPAHRQAPPRTEEALPLEGVRTLEPILPEEKREASEEPFAPPQGQPPSQSRRQIDRAIIIELAKWVNNGVREMGGERTEKMVEIYAKAGYLSPEVKDILLHFISLSHEEKPPKKVEMKAVLVTLLKLDRVLGNGTDAEVALSLLEEESWTRQ